MNEEKIATGERAAPTTAPPARTGSRRGRGKAHGQARNEVVLVLIAAPLRLVHTLGYPG